MDKQTHIYTLSRRRRSRSSKYSTSFRCNFFTPCMNVNLMGGVDKLLSKQPSHTLKQALYFTNGTLVFSMYPLLHYFVFFTFNRIGKDNVRLSVVGSLFFTLLRRHSHCNINREETTCYLLLLLGQLSQVVSVKFAFETHLKSDLHMNLLTVSHSHYVGTHMEYVYIQGKSKLRTEKKKRRRKKERRETREQSRRSTQCKCIGGAVIKITNCEMFNIYIHFVHCRTKKKKRNS